MMLLAMPLISGQVQESCTGPTFISDNVTFDDVFPEILQSHAFTFETEAEARSLKKDDKNFTYYGCKFIPSGQEGLSIQTSVVCEGDGIGPPGTEGCLVDVEYSGVSCSNASLCPFDGNNILFTDQCNGIRTTFPNCSPECIGVENLNDSFESCGPTSANATIAPSGPAPTPDPPSSPPSGSGGFSFNGSIRLMLALAVAATVSMY